MSHARRTSTVRFPVEAARSPQRTSMDLPTSPSLEIDVPFQLWLQTNPVLARHLVDVPAVVIDGESPVEKACEALLAGGSSSCLIVQSKVDAAAELHFPSRTLTQNDGLFDYADVNSFLLLGLNARTLVAGQVEDPRTSEILQTSKQGVVPIRLACNISQKNPMQVRDEDATLAQLLQIYSTGTHRVVVQSPTGALTGLATDLSLIRFLLTSQNDHPSVKALLARPLFSLAIGDAPAPVVSATVDNTILDAMVLMDAEGVNSIAVLDRNGALHSAVSVTDIGNLVIPSQSKDVLSTKLGHFVSRIKWPAGATDGRDHFPVYSIAASSTLEYAMEKLAATNAHRLFLVNEPSGSTSPVPFGNLRGVVSVVDVLSVFARLAGIPDVDPFHLRRKRRTSSSSSRSSGHSRHSSLSQPTPPSSVSSFTGTEALK